MTSARKWSPSTVATTMLSIPLIGIVGDLVDAALAPPEQFSWAVHFFSAAVWVSWILLVPVVLRLAARVPLLPPRFGAWALHLAGILTATAAHLALVLLIQSADSRALLLRDHFADRVFLQMAPLYFAVDLTLWLITIGIATALEGVRRVRLRRLAEAAVRAEIARTEAAGLRGQIDAALVLRALECLEAEIPQDPPAAERIMDRLGEFLQRTLRQQGRSSSSVREEADLAGAELALRGVCGDAVPSFEAPMEAAVAEARVAPFALASEVRQFALSAAGADAIEIVATVQDEACRVTLRAPGHAAAAVIPLVADEGGVLEAEADLEPEPAEPAGRHRLFWLAPLAMTLLGGVIPLSLGRLSGLPIAPARLGFLLVNLAALALFLPLLGRAVRRWAPVEWREWPRLLLLLGLTVVFAVGVESAYGISYSWLAPEGRQRPILDIVRMAASTNTAALNRYFFLAALAIFLSVHYRRLLDERRVGAGEVEARLAEARLRVLKMQLQPHFLFNSLNAIAAVAEENPSAAAGMTANLRAFLRRSFERADAPELTLQEELDFLQSYLAVERVRFGDRLHVSVEVGDDLERALVPALMLQPLVENAIRHGIAPRKGAGSIAIEAQRRGSDLGITVRDDGRGFPAQASMRLGLGLANTRDRLGRMFGARQSVTVRSEEGAGFSVELVFPLRYGTEGGPR